MLHLLLILALAKQVNGITPMKDGCPTPCTPTSYQSILLEINAALVPLEVVQAKDELRAALLLQDRDGGGQEVTTNLQGSLHTRVGNNQ